MAKLVILTQGLADKAHELKADRTTVGRVEDNMFQIAEPSVSSHHAEILLRGSEVVIKDLDSTNGTFINGEKISERVLQPGQTLRFGNIELRLDVPGAPAPVATPAPAPALAPTQPKTTPAGTMVIPHGVSMGDLESSGGRPAGFDANKQFAKKTNKVNLIFLVIGIVAAVLIIGLIFYAITLTKNSTGGGQ